MIVARQEIIAQLLVTKEKPEIVVQFVLSAYIFLVKRDFLTLVSFTFPTLSTTFTLTR